MKAVSTEDRHSRGEVFVGAEEESESLQSVLELNPGQLTFYSTGSQIDTGADISFIPEDLYKKLMEPSSHSTSKSLVSPSQDTLQVRGQFKHMHTKVKQLRK